jgi:hypothetical protein
MRKKSALLVRHTANSRVSENAPFISHENGFGLLSGPAHQLVQCNVTT